MINNLTNHVGKLVNNKMRLKVLNNYNNKII